ncbi:MAG: threonine aldolase family protein [Spirochaeta sp.]
MQERFFASDNSSPVHPSVVAAITEANQGHSISYGADPWTSAAVETLQGLFTGKPEVFFVYNGTGANTIALRSIVPPYGATLCTDAAHINCDEAGAVQAAGAGRLHAVAGIQGKLLPAHIEEFAADAGVEHHSQPAAVSITQPTELGTVYSLSELQDIAACCRKYGLKLHMDGARLANACVSLKCSIAEVTRGVDVLAFGGTKNGMLFGEALIVFDREAAQSIRFHRKQMTQLHSKMRYIAAQFSALVKDSLYLQNAAAANAAARRLADGIAAAGRQDVVIQYPVQSNAVFVGLPENDAVRLQKQWPFYHWKDGVYRLMCSYDTTERDIDDFLRVFRGASS